MDSPPRPPIDPSPEIRATLASPEKLKGANLLMGIALMPMALWALHPAGMVATCGAPVCDLTTGGLALLLGGLSYGLLLGLGGFGLVSAGRCLRANPGLRAPGTRLLQLITGVSIGMPWIGLVAFVAKAGA